MDQSTGPVVASETRPGGEAAMIAGSWWTSRLLGGAISMGTATAPAAQAAKWTG